MATREHAAPYGVAEFTGNMKRCLKFWISTRFLLLCSRKSERLRRTDVWFPDLAMQLCCRPSGMTGEGIPALRHTHCRHPRQVQQGCALIWGPARQRSRSEHPFHNPWPQVNMQRLRRTDVWFPDLVMQLRCRPSGMTGEGVPALRHTHCRHPRQVQQGCALIWGPAHQRSRSEHRF